MTRRDWYIGVFILALALVFHAAFPRYEYRARDPLYQSIRIDRWTGQAAIVGVQPRDK